MDLVQQGQKISLNIIKNETLVEIIGIINDVFDDRLIVELPAYFMRYIEYLDVGCTLTVKIFSKLGTIDFNSIVISSPLEEEYLEIEFDVNALKFTPSSELPVINSIENLKIIRKEGEINTQTFVISTEFIKFYSDVKLNIDESLDCELYLPNEFGVVKFKANVREQDIVYDNEYKASYFNMNEQDRETLIYYMYVYANENPEESETQEKTEEPIENETGKQEES